MQIKLEPHVGTHLVTGKEITHAQDRVFIDGQFVGYLQHGDPLILSLIRHVSPAEIVEAVNTIRQQRRQKVHVVSPAPDIPPELLRQDDEDEEDDE